MTPEFGATAWGRAWLRLAEPTTVTTVDTRLPKARALARRGRVESLMTAPGRIDAVVRTHDAEHPVRFAFPPWDDAARGRIDAFLGEDPAARRALSGGDAPDELAAAVGDVAPDEDAVEAACRCRERRRPCLHQLAVLYALVQRIDEEPTLALALRGWDRSGAAVDDSGAAPVPLAALDPARFYTWRGAPADG